MPESEAMNNDAAMQPSKLQPSEIGTLAGELARSYADFVKFYRDKMEASAEEADAQARRLGTPFREQILSNPPEQVSWHHLSLLAEHDPQEAQNVWERVKRAARDELESGHRAAKAMAWRDSPFERAQFLAVHDSFIEEWQPRGGIEMALIDMMAHSYSSYLKWMNTLASREYMQSSLDRHYIEKQGRRKPVNMGDEDAADHAAAMADRFNRLYLRTLRQLRDLRRYSPVVIQNNGGQVNVASQQVNVTK